MRQMLVGEDDEQPPEYAPPADWVYQMLTDKALDGKIVVFPVWDSPMSATAHFVEGNQTKN